MTFGWPVQPTPHHVVVPVSSVEREHMPPIRGYRHTIRGDRRGTGPTPVRSRRTFPRNVHKPSFGATEEAAGGAARRTPERSSDTVLLAFFARAPAGGTRAGGAASAAAPSSSTARTSATSANPTASTRRRSHGK